MLKPSFDTDDVFRIADRLWRYHGEKVRGERAWETLFSFPTKSRNLDLLLEYLELPDSPVYWRALLEAFAEHHVQFEGAPTKWTARKEFELAFDLLDIGLRKRVEKWTVISAITHLENKQPYKDRWADFKDKKKRADGFIKYLRPRKGARLKPDEILIHMLKALKAMDQEFFFFLVDERDRELRSRKRPTSVKKSR